MKQTLGDYWRQCSDEELATNMVDFLMELVTQMEIPLDDIDWAHEYNVFLSFFKTEYETGDDSSNKYEYIN